MSYRFFFVHQVSNELQGVILRHGVDTAHFILVTNAVTIFRNSNKFWAEGTCDELCRIVWVVSLIINYISNRLAVGRIESLIEFVKNVKGCRIAALNRKDESHGHQERTARARLSSTMGFGLDQENHCAEIGV